MFLRQPIIANDYFTIITIIGPTINRSDASLKSSAEKNALFWIRAVILLFRAEILPCGPPLLPHSCAEPFLGVVQKYSFLGDIYTSA